MAKKRIITNPNLLVEELDGKLTLKVKDGGTNRNVAVAQGNVTGSSLVEVTYDELVELRDGGKLVPGCKYRIIDYETIIDETLGTAEYDDGDNDGPQKKYIINNGSDDSDDSDSNKKDENLSKGVNTRNGGSTRGTVDFNKKNLRDGEDMPYMKSAGIRYDIVVEAVSNDTLSKNATALKPKYNPQYAGLGFNATSHDCDILLEGTNDGPRMLNKKYVNITTTTHENGTIYTDDIVHPNANGYIVGIFLPNGEYIANNNACVVRTIDKVEWEITYREIEMLDTSDIVNSFNHLCGYMNCVLLLTHYDKSDFKCRIYDDSYTFDEYYDLASDYNEFYTPFLLSLYSQNIDFPKLCDDYIKSIAPTNSMSASPIPYMYIPKDKLNTASVNELYVTYIENGSDEEILVKVSDFVDLSNNITVKPIGYFDASGIDPSRWTIEYSLDNKDVWYAVQKDRDDTYHYITASDQPGGGGESKKYIVKSEKSTPMTVGAGAKSNDTELHYFVCDYVGGSSSNNGGNESKGGDYPEEIYARFDVDGENYIGIWYANEQALIDGDQEDGYVISQNTKSVQEQHSKGGVTKMILETNEAPFDLLNTRIFYDELEEYCEVLPLPRYREKESRGMGIDFINNKIILKQQYSRAERCYEVMLPMAIEGQELYNCDIFTDGSGAIECDDKTFKVYNPDGEQYWYTKYRY